MDLPAKFASITPSLEEMSSAFKWRRHPMLPELEMLCLPSKNEHIKKQLTDQGHSWQWPYLWECGVALGRWVLDNRDVVKDKIVYDLGTGQGTACIAAKMAGAKISIGVDCCVYSEFVVSNNGSRNKQSVVSYTTDLFDAKIADNSVILASDLIYGQPSSNKILDILTELGDRSTVIFAISGRTNPKYTIDHPRVKQIAHYDVPCFTSGLELTETMPVSIYLM